MKRKGFIRNTKQREQILDVLRSTRSHPTADWVYQEVRKEMPNISLGTIYRNLKTLTEMGEAIELSYGSTYSRFDGFANPHYHFVCEQCGSIQDLELTPLEGLEETVGAETGGQVSHHRLEFYGLCRDCAKEMRDQSSAAQ